MVNRRKYPRLVLNSPVLVSVGKSKAGLLFDIGEGGLSVHGVVPESQGEFTQVAFDLPQGDGSIEARVGIAWTSVSANRTGMRFELVGRGSQRQLKQLISGLEKSKKRRLTVV
ncbi:MAG: PilZ domain-containing protein [Candidatus Acidiferrales bacterium]|jgi:hypothetical protein